MRTLNVYIAKSFLVTFLATVVVFTFVLSIGGVFKLTDLVARGVPWQPLVKIFFSGMPFALTFAIPISALTAALLEFGRLSADSEITAMKACGISLWQVMGWMLPPAVALAAVCLYVNNDLVPNSHYARRSARARLVSVNPVDLLDEGRQIRDFEGLTIYIGKKDDNRLEDVRIYDPRNDGRWREIKAKRGTVSMDGNDVVLELEAVTLDPFSFDRPVAAYCDKWTERIESESRHRGYTKKVKDWTFSELLEKRRRFAQQARGRMAEARNQRIEAKAKFYARFPSDISCFTTVPFALTPPDEAYLGALPAWIRDTALYFTLMQAAELRFLATRMVADQQNRRERAEAEVARLREQAMEASVELHKRFSLSFSCIAFIFLGVPLGIRSHRKESSVGVAMSLLLVFCFYLFILAAEELRYHPELHPDILTWMPVALSLLIGSVLINRMR